GKVDPLSEEGIGRATELAALASGIPLSPASGTGKAIAQIARAEAGPTAETLARQQAARDFGIALSRGQSAADPAAQRLENLAARGAHGEETQQAAKEFFEQQQADIERAQSGIGTVLGREGRTAEAPIIRSPREAGEVAGEEIREAA